MGETSNFYEKCSSLSKKGDEKSLRTLLQMGISGNKTARVALRKTRNKKLLKTLIDEYLDNIPSEYNAGMILNLAVKVLRKEYLYVYLMEIFHEKKDLKEIVDYLDHCLIIETGSLKETTLKALQDENFRIIQFAFRPTAENMAKYFYDKMIGRGYRVKQITVYETPNNAASYTQD